MKDGYGAPFAFVFNSEGTMVLNKVSRFEYYYTEVVDDATTIVVETEDLSIVDHPDLQEGNQLQVVWGYIGGKVSAKRIVYIWETKVNFGVNHVRFQIVAYNKAAYLKLNSKQDMFENVTVEGLANLKAEDLGLKIEGPDEYWEQEWVGTRNESWDIVDKDGNPYYEIPADATKRKRIILKAYPTIVQGNKSDAKTIEEAARRDYNDVIVDGRDDKLLIKVRNFDQPPIRVYEYRNEPGDVIEFVPATRSQENKKASTSIDVKGWDPETKEYYNGLINGVQDPSTRLGSFVELDRDSALKQIADNFDKPIEAIGLTEQPTKEETYYQTTDENGSLVYKKKKVTDVGDGKKWGFFVKRGSVPSDLVIGKDKSFYTAAKDVVGRVPTKGLFQANVVDSVESTEDNAKDAADEAIGRLSDSSKHLYESNLTVLGDPELECSKIISILGVGQKYSGNYYIQSVKHLLGQEGYICELVLLKNSLGKVPDDFLNKVDPEELGIRSNNFIRPTEGGVSDFIKLPIIEE